MSDKILEVTTVNCKGKKIANSWVPPDADVVDTSSIGCQRVTSTEAYLNFMSEFQRMVEQFRQFVPYIGASGDVNLGYHTLIASGLRITNHPVSGYYLACDASGNAFWADGGVGTFVPYTGALYNVDLGSNGLSASFISVDSSGEVDNLNSNYLQGHTYQDIISNVGSGFVPYTNATSSVDLGEHTLTASSLYVSGEGTISLNNYGAGIFYIPSSYYAGGANAGISLAPTEATATTSPAMNIRTSTSPNSPGDTSIRWLASKEYGWVLMARDLALGAQHKYIGLSKLNGMTAVTSLGFATSWDATLYEPTIGASISYDVDSNTLTTTSNISAGIGNFEDMTIVVTSLVENLNSDMLDDYHASSFSLSGHSHSGTYVPYLGAVSDVDLGAWNISATTGIFNSITISSSGEITNLNSNYLQGYTYQDIIDSIPSVTGYVPYTGAVSGVDLNSNYLIALDLYTQYVSGTELVPTISGDTWSGENWVIEENLATHIADKENTQPLYPTIPIEPEIGSYYELKFTIGSGSFIAIDITIGGISIPQISSAATYTYYILATTTDTLLFTPTNGKYNGAISDVSLKKLSGGSLNSVGDVNFTKNIVENGCFVSDINGKGSWNDSIYLKTTGANANANIDIGTYTLSATNLGVIDTGYFQYNTIPFLWTDIARSNVFLGCSISTRVRNNFNTLIGHEIAPSATDITHNTIAGSETAQALTIGYANNIFGSTSFTQCESGNNNSVFGHTTLTELLWGEFIVAVGNGAGQYWLYSTYNTAIGGKAGGVLGIETSDYCTFLGYETDVTTEGLINTCVIGNGARASYSNIIQLGNTEVCSGFIGNYEIWTEYNLLKPIFISPLSQDLSGNVSIELSAYVPYTGATTTVDLNTQQIYAEGFYSNPLENSWINDSGFGFYPQTPGNHIVSYVDDSIGHIIGKLGITAYGDRWNSNYNYFSTSDNQTVNIEYLLPEVSGSIGSVLNLASVDASGRIVLGWENHLELNSINLSGGITASGDITTAGNLYATIGNFDTITVTSTGLVDNLNSDFHDGFHVQGYSVGFTDMPSFTEDGSGGCEVGSGTIRLYDNALGSGQLREYPVASGAFSFADASNNYIICSLSGSIAILSSTTDVSVINESNVAPVYTVYRDGLLLYKLPWTSLAQNLDTRLHYRLVKTDRFGRQSGLTLSTSGLTVLVDSGIIFYGVDEIQPEAFDSSTDLCYILYHSAPDTWAKQATTTLNNLYYDDNTGGLKTLSSNRIAVTWVYRAISSDYKRCCFVLGEDDYTMTQAVESMPPANLPSSIASHFMLVGKILTRKDATEAEDIFSQFEELNYPSEKRVYDGLNVTAGNGVVSGMALSINTDTTKFDIASGYYYIPESGLVKYNGESGIAVTNIASALVSYIALDIDENVIQKTIPYTAEERRDYVILGVVVHSNKTSLNAINNLPDVGVKLLGQYNDLLDALKMFNHSGNIFSASASAMCIAKSSGELFKRGVNFNDDPLNPYPDNPHVKTMAPLDPITTLRFRDRNGIETANVSAITDEINKWDDAGTITTIGSPAKFTIIRIALFSSNIVRAQYGQHLYNKMSDAKQAMNSETFEVEDNIAQNGLFRCILIVKSNCTDLTDTDQAQFFNLNRFGEISQGMGGIGGTTDLQQAYNNSILGTIITDATRDGIKFQSGLASGNVFLIKDITGTSQFGIDVSGNVTASGTITASSAILSGIAITTSPTSGYLLTSDSSGNGYWTNPLSAYSPTTTTSGYVPYTGAVSTVNLSGQNLITTGTVSATYIAPMSAQGDIIYGGVSGAATRLTSGTTSTVLHGGTSPSWGAVVETDLSFSDTTLGDTSINKHGLAPKLSNNINQYFSGVGTFEDMPELTWYLSAGFTDVISANVAHNYGQYPVVQVLDSNNSLFMPASVVHNTKNDFTVTFAQNTTGTILVTIGSSQLFAMSQAQLFARTI